MTWIFWCLSFWSCERWLCAPFFFSYALLSKKLFEVLQIQTYQTQFIAVFQLLFCVFVWICFVFVCIRQHDVNILMHKVAQDVMRWLCAPFFSLFFMSIVISGSNHKLFSKQLSLKSHFFVLVCGYVCLLLHKTTWREYFDV